MKVESSIRAKWLGKLGNLNTARTAARGIAPHKPLMLLTVIDLIEFGDIQDGWVKYDVRIVSRFRDYWELVRERQRNAPDIPMPFNALGGNRDKVWECFTADGKPSKAKETTRLCSFDPELFSLLQDSNFRVEVRKNLIAVYFTAEEQVMLSERLRLPVPKTSEVQALRGRAKEFKAMQKKGRDSRFKSEVLSGYYFTCALTGYRLQTQGSSMVHAAHIHQHSKSGNDELSNGLALSPDAHWLFDAGLWTVRKKEDDFFIEIAIGRYEEISPYSRRLEFFHDKPLHLHPDSRLRPDPQHLAWHRKEHGFTP